MRKGGYKIVDFKSAELSSTVVVRPGIYSQIIDDYDKPILVSGVSLSGLLKDDAFASVSEVTGDSGDSVELGVYGGVITVTEDDEVSFVSSKSNAELAQEIEELDDKVDTKISYKATRYSTATSFNSSEVKEIIFDVSLAGYAPKGILAIFKGGANSGYVSISQFYLDGNNVKLALVNTYTAEITLTFIEVNVMYEKV